MSSPLPNAVSDTTGADYAVARLRERFNTPRGSGYLSEDEYEDVKLIISLWEPHLAALADYRAWRAEQDRLLDALESSAGMVRGVTT